MSADEIRRVLGWTEWTSKPLTHNALNAVTRGIWRLTADRPVILKVLTGSDEGRPGWESSHDPRHWNYWRREAEVYAEGLPRLWKGSGLRAPQPLAVIERDDGDVALYLEDVSDDGTPWTVGRHARMALQLGRAQGGVAEIERPWLSRSFLRDYVGSKAVPYELLDDGEAWGHPLVREHFPDSVFDLFMPAADLPALDRACYGSYVRGLRQAGWRGDERLVRLAVCASAIKYDWLVPAMLRAVDREQLDYGGARPVEAARRYRERGQAMMFLAGWADEARRLAETL